MTIAQNTPRFAPYVSQYLEMIQNQLTYDALKIIGFDQRFGGSSLGEMRFMYSLAQAEKTIQGLIVARKEK